ncbi:MAG: LamG domain-containing protein [Deltaproteobacteria bacterium]|nr:LamG domain-containing protein [Deltaproteobacteria bacterium]
MKSITAKLTLLSMIVLCLFTGVSYAQGAKNAIAEIWLFDEGKGKTVADASGNGHDGEIIKGDAEWVEGKFGTALDFPGDETNVSIPHEDSLNLTTFTITAWVKIRGVKGCLVNKEIFAATHSNYAIGVTNTNVVWSEFTANGTWLDVLGNTEIVDDKWHHIAATYDQKFQRVYVDGEKDAEKAHTEKPDTNLEPLTFGSAPKVGGNPTGTIDEVGLFNEALTEDEIKSIMTKGLKSATSVVSTMDKLAVTWGSIKSQ